MPYGDFCDDDDLVVPVLNPRLDLDLFEAGDRLTEQMGLSQTRQGRNTHVPQLSTSLVVSQGAIPPDFDKMDKMDKMNQMNRMGDFLESARSNLHELNEKGVLNPSSQFSLNRSSQVNLARKSSQNMSMNPHYRDHAHNLTTQNLTSTQNLQNLSSPQNLQNVPSQNLQNVPSQNLPSNLSSQNLNSHNLNSHNLNNMNSNMLSNFSYSTYPMDSQNVDLSRNALPLRNLLEINLSDMGFSAQQVSELPVYGKSHHTPRRVGRNKSLSVSLVMTPLKGNVNAHGGLSPINLAATCNSKVKKKGHQRSRSRLLMDTVLSHLTSFTSLNPFYTPSTFALPKMDQISTDLDDPETPLPTPGSRLKALLSGSPPGNSPLLDDDAFKALRKAKSFTMDKDENRRDEKNENERYEERYDHENGNENENRFSMGEKNQMDSNRPTYNLLAEMSGTGYMGKPYDKIDLLLPQFGQESMEHGLLPPMATFPVTQYGMRKEDEPTVPTLLLVQLGSMAKIDIPVVKNNRGDKSDRLDPKKKHKCPICDSRFQRPEHVKRHMKSHSLDKPFQCDEAGCGKRFNRKDNLKAHLKKIHRRQF